MKGKQKILIAGGTGLIGQYLIEHLPKEKYDIHILTRNPIEAHDNVSYFKWDLHTQKIEEAAVNVDYIINLTGAGIADKRWSVQRKKVLIESRVKSLLLLKSALERTGHSPTCIISASAVGYYGDRSSEVLTENSLPGEGFMAECCKLWEEAALSLSSLTDRLAILRIGIVLSTKGGALPKMLMTEKARILNYFGSGRQYYSWIHIADIGKMIETIISDHRYHGIFNAVAPVALTNKEFVIKIGEGLQGSFLCLPVPAFGLRLAMGEMADVVLNSNRVVPQKLKEAGFEFWFPDLPKAISHLVEAKI